jgi:diguanylate cyclase (GGDEF)-like protein
MPGIDGYEVLRRLRADPRSSDTPVVFLSGRALASDVVEAFGLGAHDYLRKPFAPTELEARVDAAIQIYRLQAELRQANTELDLQARTDSLTGLWNRRHLQHQLEVRDASARGRGESFVVLMVDIDRFKAINDTYGHEEGDKVLRQVASCLQSSVRPDDVVGRWGGEEFLLILPRTHLAAAMVVGARICARVRENYIDVGGSRPVRVTVSVGVAVSTSFHGSGPDDVARAADQALYDAKALGRDQVREASNTAR